MLCDVCNGHNSGNVRIVDSDRVDRIWCPPARANVSSYGRGGLLVCFLVHFMSESSSRLWPV